MLRTQFDFLNCFSLLHKIKRQAESWKAVGGHVFVMVARMGVFRSERMLLCQILLSQETVFDCVEALGNAECVQFRDLNAGVTQYQRRYVGDIRRCEEMERKIRLLEEEIIKSDTPIGECKEIPSAPGARETLSLETNLETLVGEMGNVNKSGDVLKRNLVELTEQYHVVKKASVWLQANQLVFDEENGGFSGIGHLRITTGVILLEKVKPFEVLVWRVCRGVAFIRIIHITQPLADADSDSKAVFVIICQGDNLNGKILKICEAFHCSLYLSPASADRRRELERETLTGIRETQQVMRETDDHRKRVLLVAAMNITRWKLQVLKLKSIYHVMNMLQLDEINEFQTAECWVPESELAAVRARLHAAAERSSNRNDPIIIVKGNAENPPTFNRTNKFTKAFQTLVDSYGVSVYREVNPMPYTIVTFPFLFAVMFGDVGHGLILTIFAMFLVLHEEKLQRKAKGEVEAIFFEGRYIILLMGIFSCYTGFIYNDFFSKSVKLFRSSWRFDGNVSESSVVQLDPSADFTGRPYIFGMDPIWQCSENKVIFVNSFKMKISIILGVLHMTFGMVLSAGNHLYFGNHFNIYTELIPELVYFSALFLYLVFLIFAKWAMYGRFAESINCAPNILVTFINMVMFKPASPGKDCPPGMYPHQQLVQTVLVILAFFSVPWLFAAKTTVLLHHRRSNFLNRSEGDPTLDPKGGKLVFDDDDEEEEEFDYEKSDVGEIIIHQGIRTIEFVLGSVSHTASYLRLWALSLAHAQLSDVLWRMVLHFGIAARGNTAVIYITVCFAAWATLTVGILVLMEGLSAFLHTLRLHWVEFQSKFYSGTGRAFEPYSFRKILKTE